MLRFTASKLLDRSLDLLKGAFLHITGAAASVYSNPTNQLKRFVDLLDRNSGCQEFFQ